MQIALALVITLVSACLLNLGYLLEHSVASKVPPLSLRRPIASVRSLLGNRRWLMGFGSEASGWLLYVVALALAPLSLVQAVAAGGIGILAVMVARLTHVPLTPPRAHRRRAVGGRARAARDQPARRARRGLDARYGSVGLWLGASAVAARRFLWPCPARSAARRVGHRGRDPLRGRRRSTKMAVTAASRTRRSSSR